MLIIQAEPRSVDRVLDHVDEVKERIFAKMREGMQEAMEGLATEAVAQATAAGIQSRTGQLFEDILNSPKVRENAELIFGRVSTESEMTIAGRKFKGFLGTALDEGFHVRSEHAKAPYQFTGSDGGTFYARGHVAFDVKPHPFLRRTKEAFTAPILQIIAAKVAEAYDGA